MCVRVLWLIDLIQISFLSNCSTMEVLRSLTLGAFLLFGFVLFYSSVESCNEVVCASIVSKCMLTQECKCELKNCSCCKDCLKCLGKKYYEECCSCVGKLNQLINSAVISDRTKKKTQFLEKARYLTLHWTFSNAYILSWVLECNRYIYGQCCQM